VKRAVRVALYDDESKEFIANACQVNVLYNEKESQDEWKFPSWTDNGMNPILFKASQKEEVTKPSISMIFEMIIYV
jgi:hypothetical protein